MGALRTLLGLISFSFLVRQAPDQPTRNRHPGLRRTPPWALRRKHTPERLPNPPSGPTAHEVWGWDGVGDPAYLLAEIEELRDIAQHSGLGTLAHLLDRAALEARAEVRRKQNWSAPFNQGPGTTERG